MSLSQTALEQMADSQAHEVQLLRKAVATSHMSLIEDAEGHVRYVAWRDVNCKKGVHVEIRRKKPVWMPAASIKAQGLEKDFHDATIIH